MLTPDLITEAMRRHARTVLMPSVARAVADDLNDAKAANAKRSAFLARPDTQTLLAHLDLGDGPSSLDLAQFLITEAMLRSNERAMDILYRIAGKVAEYAEEK
jgi:hypothetical protein